MRWQLKCLVDRFKGMLPAQDFLRRAKRRVCGFHADYGRDRGAIEEGLKQLEWVGSLLDLRSARVLEIGTGWQPIIPLLYSMAGACEVILTDLKRLCHSATLAATLDSLRASKPLIAGRLRMPQEALEQFCSRDISGPLDKSFARFSMTYLAPCDVRRAPLADGSVDAVVSRAVLEHIPPPVLGEIFQEARRILRPGGVMCHFVDNSDHWEHGDKRISRINFLKYSDRAFGWIQWNGLNYQNRLRHPEYRKLLQDAGFEIRREERTVDAKSLAILDSFPLAPRFRTFSREELATVDSCFLAVKPV